MHVVEIAVEDEEIVQPYRWPSRARCLRPRLPRRVYNPPKVAGKDDVTGEPN